MSAASMRTSFCILSFLNLKLFELVKSYLILVQQTATDMMKVGTSPKPLSYFLWLLPPSGGRVIYVVEMSETMSCKSHFSFLLTFTEWSSLAALAAKTTKYTTTTTYCTSYFSSNTSKANKGVS